MKKSLFMLPTAALMALMAVACDNSVTEPAPFAPAISDTASNVFALKPAVQPDTVFSLRGDSALISLKPFAYFDLDAKAALPSTGDTSAWDIAFRTTGVHIKGEFKVLSGTLFDSVKVAPDSGFATAAGTIPTPWHNYDFGTNVVTPKDSTVILLKTSSGKYAKIQILSYYKNRPLVPVGTDTARYYTFRYFLQKDGSKNLTPEARPFTYFSLHTGAEVSDTSTGWDIAFYSTTVKVNGQSQLLSSVDFDTLVTAPSTGYGAGSTQLTWYDYSGEPNHTITPKLATVLLVKTLDGKYAKVQYLSYYQGFPAAPDGNLNTARYYTFRYFLSSTTALK